MSKSRFYKNRKPEKDLLSGKALKKEKEYINKRNQDARDKADIEDANLEFAIKKEQTKKNEEAWLAKRRKLNKPDAKYLKWADAQLKKLSAKEKKQSAAYKSAKKAAKSMKDKREGDK